MGQLKKWILFGTLICASIVAFLSFKNKTEVKELPKNEIELGKLLFFDPILSKTNKLSCAGCHKPEFAFADTVPFSKGIKNFVAVRNTPSAMNMAFREIFFWDGRAATLEEQVLGPIANPIEMALPLDEMEKKLAKNKFYTHAFIKIYGKRPNRELVAKAIAAYERTLETGDTPFDKFIGGDSNAISKSAANGRDLFLEKGRCFECHFTPDFTADEFKNIGLFNGKNLNDSGRYLITKNKADLGKFKVPGLRNVALTAPYMHNGMFPTLEAVVDFYNEPNKFVTGSQNKDSVFIKPLNLTNQEKKDLVNFLKTLHPVK